MSITDLRQRQTTLESLRLDVQRWPLAQDAEVPRDRLPVVAVDWSEIFAYLTRFPLRESDSPETFAIHYAGLNYLLFRLPCQLVLLPPYTAEMEHFIAQIRAQTQLYKLIDPRELADKHGELVAKVQKLQEKHEAFGALLRGDWAAADQLPDDAWAFLEDLLKEDVPDLFLDIQERTADIMRSLRHLLSVSERGVKRIAALPSLQVLPHVAAMRSMEGWQHWLAEMSVQRPRLERQNRADALALAYLQSLHQALAWRGVPLYFASRSVSMLHIMEDHAGEFEPYAGAAATARKSRSSWRSWEYFAELGYYAAWSGREGNGNGNGHRTPADIEQDIRKREAKIDQRIIAVVRGGSDGSDAAPLFADWETLRGSFDLQGLGEQGHWSKIKKPRESLLVDLLGSILSAADAGTFVRRRGDLAKRLLEEIEGILGSLTPDALDWPRTRPLQGLASLATLTDIATAHLRVGPLVDEYLRIAGRASASDAGRRAAALVRQLTGSATDDERTAAPFHLLRLLTDVRDTQVLNQAVRDWLTGVALFFARLYPESVSYLSSWLETHSSAAPSGLGLATRALCAEAHRHARDYEPGMSILTDIPSERLDALSTSERLVWHCLRGQLLVDWIERAKENFEIFPKPAGRRSEVAIIAPMIEPVAAARTSSTLSLELRLQAANLLLYLAARHIPENAPDIRGPNREARLGWFLDQYNTFNALEQWFRESGDEHRLARRLHTLGYYNWKVYLLMQEPARCHKALEYFDAARKSAEQAHDNALVQHIASHAGWARETLERQARQ